MIRYARSKTRKAFTLIEVVITVLILAIAVPPTLGLLDSASAGRADAISTTRGTFLATTVLETIFADVTSKDDTLGFEALENSNLYLNDPTTGLYARLESATDFYQRVGLSYKVGIGPLVSSNGVASDTESENIFRVITVLVSIDTMSQSRVNMPVTMMISEM